MPVTKKKQAIRFKSMDKMLDAMDRDELYQQRHIAIRHLSGLKSEITRRELCEETGLPINSVSRVITQLISEGAVYEVGYKVCVHSDVCSRAIMYNRSFKGPY